MAVKIVLFLSVNQHAWDLHENVPLGLARLVKIKLFENCKRDWDDTVLTTPNI